MMKSATTTAMVPTMLHKAAIRPLQAVDSFQGDDQPSHRESVPAGQQVRLDRLHHRGSSLRHHLFGDGRSPHTAQLLIRRRVKRLVPGQLLRILDGGRHLLIQPKATYGNVLGDKGAISQALRRPGSTEHVQEIPNHRSGANFSHNPGLQGVKSSVSKESKRHTVVWT